MSIRKLLPVILLITISIFTACSDHEKKTIQNTLKLNHAISKETPIETNDPQIAEGYLMGVSFEKNEVFVNALIPEGRKGTIIIIDPITGEEKRKIQYPIGDPQSPTDFSEPSYMQYHNGNYYLIDRCNKIVVYDSNLKYKYSSMFFKFRYFIDFYTLGQQQLCFLFGEFKLQENTYFNIDLYELKFNKKPGLLENLHKSSFTPPIRGKVYQIIHFDSSTWGFEKDGDIYYTDNRTNIIYKYNPILKKTSAIESTDLKPMKYSKEDAETAGHYKQDSWAKRRKLKIVYLPGPEAAFHFGLYDVGKDKLGIIADVDIKSFTFRLDIFNCKNNRYLQSIRLPFGETFLRRISSENMGYLDSYFDVDRGLYIWPDVDAESLDGQVKITRFKIKNAAQ